MSTTLKTWLLSLSVHGIVITVAMFLTAQLEPLPQSQPFQWKVALIKPPPIEPSPKNRQPTKTRTPSVKTSPAPLPDTQPTTMVSRIERQSVQTRTVVPTPTVTRRVVQQRVVHTSVAIQPQQYLAQSQARPAKRSLAIQTKNSRNPLPRQSELRVSRSRATLPAKTSPQVVPPVTQVTLHQENQVVGYQRVSQQAPRSVTPASHILQNVESHSTSMKAAQQERTPTIIRPTLATSGSHSEQKPLAKRVPTQIQAPNRAFKSVPPVQRTNMAAHQSPTHVRATSTHGTPRKVKNLVKRTSRGSLIQKSAAPIGRDKSISPIVRRSVSINKRVSRLNSRPQTQPISNSSGRERTPAITKGVSPETLAFLRSLYERIQAAQEYPVVARQMGFEGTTMVKLILLSNGTASFLEVTEPSGYALLDQAALGTIHKILPMVPPPMVARTSMAIEVPIQFQLR